MTRCPICSEPQPSRRIAAEHREANRKANRERQEKDAKERADHKAYLSADEDVVGNPKLDLLYEKAWELGHASGFSEVENYFRDLVELIR